MIYNPENKTDAVGKCVPNATAAIPELAGNPEKYLNRSVIAEGTLSLEGNMFREGKFSLDDGGSSVRVTAWAPFSVSTCPPSVKDCSPPRTISYYIGKRVKVNGTLGFFGYAKTGYYMLVVNNAEIVGMPGAFAMTKGLCEAARGSWNECASACRGAPEGTACTMQCVQECECGGLAGFGCPEGYACTDYLPKEAEDAMGVCKPISSGMTRELCESGRGLWADERRACLCGGENDNRCPASYECDYSGVSKLITDPQGVCKPANGEMTKELCETGRGDFVVNNNGEGACVCGGFAGFGCPKGFVCSDYLPKGAADAMGICRPAPRTD